MSTETSPEPDLIDPAEPDLDEADDEGDEVEAASTRKRKPKGVADPMKHPDGHTLIDGARWHYPKTGQPSVCAIKGCERVLTRHLKADPVDEMEPADPTTETPQEQAS